MKSVTHTRIFELAIPVAELFPLFSPEGEKHWVPGWDYENVMGTTELSEDYVFLTRSHDHAAANAIWVVKKYEPEANAVEFYRIEPEEKVGLVKVKCAAIGDSQTSVEVTYRYTALSPAGERFIAGFDARAYEAFIDQWQSLLSTYFGID